MNTIIFLIILFILLLLCVLNIILCAECYFNNDKIIKGGINCSDLFVTKIHNKLTSSSGTGRGRDTGRGSSSGTGRGRDTGRGRGDRSIEANTTNEANATNAISNIDKSFLINDNGKLVCHLCRKQKCTSFSSTGTCKFGTGCKFCHHNIINNPLIITKTDSKDDNYRLCNISNISECPDPIIIDRPIIKEITDKKTGDKFNICSICKKPQCTNPKHDTNCKFCHHTFINDTDLIDYINKMKTYTQHIYERLISDSNMFIKFYLIQSFKTYQEKKNFLKNEMAKFNVYIQALNLNSNEIEKIKIKQYSLLNCYFISDFIPEERSKLKDGRYSTPLFTNIFIPRDSEIIITKDNKDDLIFKTLMGLNSTEFKKIEDKYYDINSIFKYKPKSSDYKPLIDTNPSVELKKILNKISYDTYNKLYEQIVENSNIIRAENGEENGIILILKQIYNVAINLNDFNILLIKTIKSLYDDISDNTLKDIFKNALNLHFKAFILTEYKESMDEEIYKLTTEKTQKDTKRSIQILFISYLILYKLITNYDDIIDYILEILNKLDENNDNGPKIKNDTNGVEIATRIMNDIYIFIEKLIYDFFTNKKDIYNKIYDKIMLIQSNKIIDQNTIIQHKFQMILNIISNPDNYAQLDKIIKPLGKNTTEGTTKDTTEGATEPLGDINKEIKKILKIYDESHDEEFNIMMDAVKEEGTMTRTNKSDTFDKKFVYDKFKEESNKLREKNNKIPLIEIFQNSIIQNLWSCIITLNDLYVPLTDYDLGELMTINDGRENKNSLIEYIGDTKELSEKFESYPKELGQSGRQIWNDFTKWDKLAYYEMIFDKKEEKNIIIESVKEQGRRLEKEEKEKEEKRMLEEKRKKEKEKENTKGR